MYYMIAAAGALVSAGQTHLAHRPLHCHQNQSLSCYSTRVNLHVEWEDHGKDHERVRVVAGKDLSIPSWLGKNYPYVVLAVMDGNRLSIGELVGKVDIGCVNRLNIGVQVVRAGVHRILCCSCCLSIDLESIDLGILFQPLSYPSVVVHFRMCRS